MRLIALEVCGVIAALVLVAMLGAIARHRAPWRPHREHHTTVFAEYVWALTPWLILAAGVLPAVRLIVARGGESHEARAAAAAKITIAMTNTNTEPQHDKTTGQ